MLSQAMFPLKQQRQTSIRWFSNEILGNKLALDSISSSTDLELGASSDHKCF
jgi:hypothetical protein